MIWAAAAIALLLSQPASAPRSLAGLYVIHQMEMGGALELQHSGHFRYELDYGAVSETAEGDWTSDGKTVRLTSNPMPVEPDFALVRDDPAPAGELYVAVEDGPFGTWTPLTVELQVDGFDRPILAYAEDDGRVEPPEGHRILSVKMQLPAYETGGAPVELSADRGHHMLFRVEQNDIGTAALRGETLTLDGSSLVMHRYDADIVFRREKR